MEQNNLKNKKWLVKKVKATKIEFKKSKQQNKKLNKNY